MLVLQYFLTYFFSCVSSSKNYKFTDRQTDRQISRKEWKHSVILVTKKKRVKKRKEFKTGKRQETTPRDRTHFRNPWSTMLTTLPPLSFYLTADDYVVDASRALHMEEDKNNN